MAVLVELAGQEGRTVSRDQLIKSVWPRGWVTDSVLSRCISQLRSALGDDTKSPRYIATIPRKGYRLLAQVKQPDLTPDDGLLVLPFQNLAAHGSDEYLADGLTELLIARLSVALDQRVVSRTTAMTFKGSQADMAMLREKLGVAWVVEGSILQLHEAIQIIVQLIDVSRDAHVWANTWTCNAAEIMNALNAVTRQVAAQVGQMVGPEKPQKRGSEELPGELQSAYLRGMHHLSRRAPSSLRKSIECFGEVLANDANHAPAHAAMAYAHVLLAHYGAMNVQEAVEIARAHASTALEISPGNAEATTHMAAIKYFHDWDFAGAETLINSALEARPNYEMALLLLADVHLVQGRHDKAIALVDKAIATDPLNVGLLMNAGDLLILLGRFTEAINSLDRALDLEPTMRPVLLRKALAFALIGEFNHARDSLAMALHASPEDAMSIEYETIIESLAGNIEKSKELAARLEAISESGVHVAPWQLARAFAASRDDDKCVGYLRKAYEDRSTSMPFLGASPVFKDLRQHPSVVRLLEEIGVPSN